MLTHSNYEVIIINPQNPNQTETRTMESSASSFQPVSPIHLALAALFGASVMAVSAFYIHKRSLDQALERLIKIRRQSPPSAADDADHFASDDEEHEDHDGGGEIDNDIDTSMWRQRLPRPPRNENALHSYRVSSSMPNVGLSSEWLDDDERPMQFQASSFDKLNFIPSGLPPLQPAPKDGEDQSVNKSASKMWVGSGGRLMTPRSSGGYAFESAGDSDEEGTDNAAGEDTLFTYQNINSSTEYMNDSYSNIQNSSIAPSKTDIGNRTQDEKCGKIENGAEAYADQHGNEKVDTAAVHNLWNDPIFANTIPLTTAAHESVNTEEEEVRKMLRECLDLRESYLYREKVAPWMNATIGESCESETKSDPFHFVPVEATAHTFRMEDGVVHVYASENDLTDLFPVASSTTFFTDMHHLLKIMSIGNVRSMCHHRLRFLEEKFRLHLLVNADREFLDQKGAPHRDFYNIRKVDTHVHHSACMNQKHLLHFIKTKLRKEPDEVVIFRDGIYFTLKEVFESLDLTGHDLNVDLLDVHADKSTFHRFDKFNLKYNPCGQSRLREIFLKQDNLIQGRFLGEVTKQVLSDLEASKYQMAEYRVSIYGRKQSEWDQLASWFINNAIYSDNAVWLIQLPRLYNVYKSMGIVTSFQNILDNVFIPLFEVTIDPNSHPQLHVFLMQVVGLDLVDDESKPERRPTKHMPKPSEWTNEFNPAYSYYAYYFYANFYTLNKLRESKGLPTIRFRPHCGEAGDIDHLAAAFLLCHNISHGINLRKSPVLQYLYYLAQIGLAMSPLSNNSLFLDYHRNPFPIFFQRGLNVSLSSDDPLQIHLTKEPLVEEYSVAAKVWKLTSCDLCEIARNSVYQSGFSHAAKLHWLGSKYFKRGPEGNDIQKTNVPNMRISFRHETWKEEMQHVYSGKARLPEEIEI
ncbi:probable AMP deaminase [Cornus florida]|uniref:probable AMP deaminase n=1 Tax=Cornus florida TaxID=4283 RepID=UPI00289CC528|nr:probable AMP deaminase [Cornus florida]